MTFDPKELRKIEQANMDDLFCCVAEARHAYATARLDSEEADKRLQAAVNRLHETREALKAATEERILAFDSVSNG